MDSTIGLSKVIHGENRQDSKRIALKWGHAAHQAEKVYKSNYLNSMEFLQSMVLFCVNSLFRWGKLFQRTCKHIGEEWCTYNIVNSPIPKFLPVGDMFWLNTTKQWHLASCLWVANGNNPCTLLQTSYISPKNPSSKLDNVFVDIARQQSLEIPSTRNNNEPKLGKEKPSKGGMGNKGS